MLPQHLVAADKYTPVRLHNDVHKTVGYGLVNPHKERLSVSDAAKLLSITPEAVRQRIRRGTIEHERTEDGRYFVYVTPTEDVENNVRQKADLRDYVETLKRELEIRNEELRRKDHIIMSLTQRIPELEPASAARDAPVAASEGLEKDEGRAEPEKRSWLRRFFGL